MIYGLQSKAEYVPYYRNSLLYLACIELSEIETEERILRAHDLSISALLGDAIYNFGELVCRRSYYRSWPPVADNSVS